MYTHDPPAGPFLPKLPVPIGPGSAVSLILAEALQTWVGLDLSGSRYADPFPITSPLTLAETHYARLSSQGDERHP